VDLKITSVPSRQKLDLWAAWFVPAPGKISTASSGNFNDAMVRNRRFTIWISDRMEHWYSVC